MENSDMAVRYLVNSLWSMVSVLVFIAVAWEHDRSLKNGK